MTRYPTPPVPEAPPPTPDWLKLLLLGGLIGLVVLVGLAIVSGVPHGPGMH